MRDFEIQAGDAITYRPGGTNLATIFVEDVDYDLSTPTMWVVRGPHLGRDGRVWRRDLNKRGPYDYLWWRRVRPDEIESVGVGRIREVDDDTGLLVEWSPTDQAYAVKQGEHRYVCMTTTFAEAMEAVRSYR